MKEEIWKFPLPVNGNVCMMPEGAEVLCVQTQRNLPYIWARVNTESPNEIRRFHVYGTGHRIDGEKGRYIGTFQLDGGALVFHVFDQSKVAE